MVDWRKHPTEMGPSVEHRLSDGETRAMLETEGFIVEPLTAPNADVYALFGRRA